VSEARRGLIFGVSAYAIWGSFPLYCPLLKPATAPEILAHRVVWSALLMAVLVVTLRRSAFLRGLWTDRRAALLLGGAAAVLSVNWLTYIWAVNNDHVVDSSLGYFVNPLVSVLLGIVVLGERLRQRQWLAVAIAAVAVVVLTVDYGRPPWIALVLACSFGTYGLLRKVAGVGAVEALAFETAVTVPVAALFLVWLGADNNFGAHGAGHAAMLATTGLVTVVPLICFGAAATRIPLVTLGLLQYLAPVLQFLLGVLWLAEPMSAGRWAGFALVWFALVVFSVEALAHRRRLPRPVEPISPLSGGKFRRVETRADPPG
jgi:chloramphenicol-sensitive protein RarD